MYSNFSEPNIWNAYLYSKEEAYPLDISVEMAFKLIISGGYYRRCNESSRTKR